MPENEFAAAAETDAAAATGTAGLPDPETQKITAEPPANDAASERNPLTDDSAQTAATDDAAAPTDAAATQSEPQAEAAEPEEEEEISYHAVQKDNNVTAIWEMQGRKHIRTIDPRSREGSEILQLFSAEEGEEQAA